MGGQSSQTTTQKSETAPWAAAQPALQGILGQLQGQMGSTAVTGAENNALTNIVNNSNAGSATYAPMVQNYATSLLNGGGANAQSGNINQNYLDYVKNTQGLASNTDYNPYSTPGFGDAINTLRDDITGQVNGSFAAAGRDFSGANSQALGRGLMQGLAPVIQSQYNQNVSNQQGAAGNLYNAGNTNAGLLTGLQQQYLANQGQGVTAAGQAVDTANAGSNAVLNAEATKRGIPTSQLGLLAQIGVPIAGLGGTSSGTSTTTNQASPLQQFQQLAGGLGSLFGGGGGTTVGNIFKFISDRRLKQDIKQVGTAGNGLPLYAFSYTSAPNERYVGVMAQDLLEMNINTDAVSEENGHYVVDYAKALR